jgi:hypothetical protein
MSCSTSSNAASCSSVIEGRGTLNVSPATVSKTLIGASSPATPVTAQDTEESINEVASHIEQDMQPEDVKSVEQSLTEATNLLTGILDGAKKVAKKTDEVANTVKPLAEKLEPLVEKVAVASLWATKLWLMRLLFSSFT